MRSAAGILALVALTFALAEGVMASMCSPDMDMQMADVTATAAMAHGGMGDGSHDHDREQNETDTECPLGPAAMGQGCGGLALLPAHGATQIAPTPVGLVDVPTQRVQSDLLLGNALFHPPRA